ncbi:Sec1 family domain-containing protein [Nymphaea thermarum]|nr:Sec1 family domain-containing protein [Nymphaea thermarum]
MGSLDIAESCLNSIRQISDEVADAFLYLDAGCSEAFQFMGAFSLLMEIGARAICSLENLSYYDPVIDWNSCHVVPAKKIVVITSRLLSDAHRYILRCLSIHQDVLRCTIFTSISEVAHSAYIDTPLGPDAFREYESLLLQDYEELMRKQRLEKHDLFSHDAGDQPTRTHQQEENFADEGWLRLGFHKQQSSKLPDSPDKGFDQTYPLNGSQGARLPLVVSVQHFPMILCPLSPHIFVLPSEGAVAEACLSIQQKDSLSPGLPPIASGLPSDGEETPPGATLTAHFLYHLAAKMDLKLEIFSLGDLSKSIGKTLMDMSSLYDVAGRNKRSAGLLLIDRTLDLITPCCHGDSLVDRMLSCLPRSERATFGPQVKGSQLQNKSISSGLMRAPLDFRIPFDSIFCGEECPTNGTQFMSECITSFISGWSLKHSELQTTDIPEQDGKYTSDNVGDFNTFSMHGSFISTANHLGENCLEAMFDKGTKDGALLIKKWLQETLYHERANSSVKIRPGFPNTNELMSMIKAIASNQASLLRNKGIIQVALAIKLALSEPQSSHWDALASAERILSVSTGDSQTLSSQIHDLLCKSISMQSQHSHAQRRHAGATSGPLSFQDAIILTVVGYILAGENFATSGLGSPFSWEEERSLKEAIVDAILEFPDIAKFRFLHDIEEQLHEHHGKLKSQKPEETQTAQPVINFDEQWGSWEDDETENNDDQLYGDMQLKLELRDRIDNMFKVFHKLSRLKRELSFREGQLLRDYSGYSSVDRGLVYKLLSLLLRKHDIPGLEYHSSAVGRILKSGFGRFGLVQAKPRFGDQSILIIFVVGGVNAREVREAREALVESGNTRAELLVGGTTLLSPDDMFDLLFGSCSFQSFEDVKSMPI